jgi:sigma-E factor negative regulatory protein RseC
VINWEINWGINRGIDRAGRIEESARIIATEGDFAWIETPRACDACLSGRGCGAASLVGLFGQRPSRFKVLNSIGARPGDDVIVAVQEGALVSGSLLLYLVPLLFLIGFAFFGEALGSYLGPDPAEGLSIVLGVTGMVFGFAWVRRITLRWNRDERFQPVILRFRHQVLPFH